MKKICETQLVQGSFGRNKSDKNDKRIQNAR